MYLQEVHWEVPFPLTKEAVDNQAIVIPDRTGVYLIWSEEKDQVLYVGSGEIIAELRRHLTPDSHVMQLGLHNLWIVYAPIFNEEDYKGAEIYLAHVYRPVIKCYRPNVLPREIKLFAIPRIQPLGIPYFKEDDPKQDFDNWLKYVIDYVGWAKEQYGAIFAGPEK